MKTTKLKYEFVVNYQGRLIFRLAKHRPWYYVEGIRECKDEIKLPMLKIIR